MNKVLFPKKDYVKELVRIFKSSKNSQKLVKALSKYHEKDIAEAITLLTPAERQHIYNVLDEHMIAEIFSYLDDAEKCCAARYPYRTRLPARNCKGSQTARSRHP